MMPNTETRKVLMTPTRKARPNDMVGSYGMDDSEIGNPAGSFKKP